MRPKIYLGTAKINITPARPVPLAGFASRSIYTEGFQDVTHPLFARIFYFEHENEQGNRQKSLFVSADLIWWGSDRVPGMKERVRARYGIPEKAVILHGTHTHSGPQMSECFVDSLGKPDPEYIRKVEEMLLDGIGLAIRDLEPVRLARGIGECFIGIHRRKRVENNVVMEGNVQGPTDPQVTVIRYESDAGLKAVWVHFACHPVITRENKISSEFVGVAMEKIEREYGNRVISAFLQGCCGDINPGMDGDFCFGDDETVCKLGDLLAGEVLAVLNRPADQLLPIDPDAKQVVVKLPLQELPTNEQLMLAARQEGVYGEWSRLLLSNPNRIRPFVDFEMSLLHIASGLTLLAMNSEVVVEYGLFMKKLFQNSVLPIPYSNGMFGYVPTARQMEEGGYEAVQSTFYFGLPSKLHPDCESLIREKLIEIANWKG